MAEVRISEIALELGYSSKEIIEKANEMGLKKIKAQNSAVSMEEAEAIYNYVQTGELPQKLKTKSKIHSKPKKEIEILDDEEPIKKSKKEKADKPKAQKTVKPKKESVSKKTQEQKEEDLNSVKEPEEIKNEEVKKETKETTSKKDIKTEIKEELKPQDKDEIKTTKSKNSETPKKEISKEKESESRIKKVESLASLSLKKRRGLVIVKKKDEPKEEEKTEVKAKKEPTQRLNIGLDEIFSNTSSNLKKKKSPKKQPLNTRKESATKIEILDDRDIKDVEIDDESEVVLPDLTLSAINVENQQKEIKQQKVYRSAQNKFTNQETRSISRGVRKKHKKPVKKDEEISVSSIDIPKEIRVYEFADKLGKQPSEIISKLFMLGLMVTKNDFLDEDALEILADEFNVTINIIDEALKFDYTKDYDETKDDEKDLVLRAPVVTIMGHVDHGKTSLLDYIRNSRVATGEAGGITQHVGAYMVEKNGRKITFIDTPGHEAFTAMRERGAEVTDVVIIIVAADDGVKPQTKEAIAHAKAANVPIIIAINKMDKPTANPDLVKSGLSELGILPIDWGGEYEFVPISAKTGTGIDELLEIVLLQADILELKANPKRMAKATVIESSLKKGLGTVATIIVQNGTLNIGDNVVAGVSYGRVRAIMDDKGNHIKKLSPGECGVIIGLSEVPESGETLIGVEDEKTAKDYASKKHDYLRQKELSKSTKVSLEELGAKIAEGELKTLPVIVKADVGGSLEAIKASLEKLRNDEIKVDIIHSGVGGITQNDIGLASASENCIILGFNVRPTGDVKERAKERGVEIKTYNVIYTLLDDVKAILGGLMSPIISEEEIGQAEIRQVINVPKIGQIAGCMVTDGNITRGADIRVIRDGVVKFEGKVSSLRRFKDDVKEVSKGFECGVGIEGYNDMQVGDYIESFVKREEQATI